MQTLDRLETEMMQLSSSQRAELAHRLLLSLEDDDAVETDRDDDEELARRIRAIDDGSAETVSHDAFLAFARERYG